jgi:hypothetical protein
MYTLKDFQAGEFYMDGNGDYISKEEALAEVEWLNKRYFKDGNDVPA